MKIEIKDNNILLDGERFRSDGSFGKYGDFRTMIDELLKEAYSKITEQVEREMIYGCKDKETK